MSLQSHEIQQYPSAELHKSVGGKCVFVVGKRATGKTTALKQLCADCKADVVLGFSRFGSAEDYGLPETMFYNEVNWDAVDRLLDVQRKRVNKATKTSAVVSSAVVFFDNLHDGNFFKSKTFRALVMNGRHLRITVIVTVQCLLDTPPAIRGNVDVWLHGRDSSVANRRRFYEHAAGFVPKFATFETVFEQLTKNYAFCVARNDLRSETWVSNMQWFKADEKFIRGMPIRLNNDAIWALSARLTKKEKEGQQSQQQGRLGQQSQQQGRLGQQSQQQGTPAFPPPLYRIPENASYPFYPLPPLPQATQAPSSYSFNGRQR